MKFEINHSNEGWELVVEHEHYIYTNLGALLKKLKTMLLSPEVVTP